MPTLSNEIDALKADALREVANIGTGHAVTALATMTNDSFSMSIPDVGVHTLSQFPESLGDIEALAAVVYMPVDGDAPGHAAFIFPFTSACEMADKMLGREGGETNELGEIECSALMEIGNILISSFLNAISDMTNLALHATPPAIAVDMAGAIFATILSVTNTSDDQVLSIMTQLSDQVDPVDGSFLFIPEPDALPTLFHALGITN